MVFVLGWFTDQSAWIINGTLSCPLVSDFQSVCEKAGLTWPKRLVCIDMYVKKLNLNKVPYMDPLTRPDRNVVFDQWKFPLSN